MCAVSQQTGPNERLWSLETDVRWFEADCGQAWSLSTYMRGFEIDWVAEWAVLEYDTIATDVRGLTEVQWMVSGV